MILDALRQVCDTLDYLHLLKNQLVFDFRAIPVSMAFATLDLKRSQCHRHVAWGSIDFVPCVNGIPPVARGD